MKVAYLECATGISGDMTLAALIDCGVDQQAIRAGIDSLRLPDVRLQVRQVMKGCFRAIAVQVEHPPQHAHRHLAEIVELIEQADAITPRQKRGAIALFEAVAAAEARVHGTTPEQIHFHEVGAVDSIVDIVGTAIGFDLLGAEHLRSAPIPTGQGEVRIAHGLCRVPTPGTVELLRGIPLKQLEIDAELTTPTGAAIVRTFATSFGPLPDMTIDVIGSGAGTLDLPDRANILRLFVGHDSTPSSTEQICLLETNLDDVTGEVLSYVQQQLFTAGALDVFFSPVTMKKSRPGVVLSVIAPPSLQSRLEAILFQETGTLGIRHQLVGRTVQSRRFLTVNTRFGPIPGKVFGLPETGEQFSPEHDACAEIARHQGCSLMEVQLTAQTVFARLTPQERSGRLIPSATPHRPASSPLPHDHDHDHP